MHRKVNSHAKLLSILMIIGFLVVIVVPASLILAKFTSSPSTISIAPLPTTAVEVAGQIKCTGFKDTGKAEYGGSLDTGTCWIGNVKYAINTFGSKANRDSWINLSEELGGNPPKWETDTSVAYVARNQSRS